MSEQTVRTATADREILIGGPDVADGPVVKFRLPRAMKSMNGAGHGKHFGKPLGDGRWLNHHCFVAGAEAGQTIVAALEIWDRIMDNGVTRHANIDLTDPAGRQPTHEMKIYFESSQAPKECPEGAEWFDLYNGGGKLVLTPI
jgi:hypothetical protein